MTNDSPIQSPAASEPFIHINWTRHDILDLSRHFCPNCNKKTFFTAFHQDWYGWDLTCLKCGDQWQDGQMCERPFARGWRKQSIERAKRHYRKLKAQGMSNVRHN